MIAPGQLVEWPVGGDQDDPVLDKLMVVDVTGDGFAVLRHPDDTEGLELTVAPVDQLQEVRQ